MTLSTGVQINPLRDYLPVENKRLVDKYCQQVRTFVDTHCAFPFAHNFRRSIILIVAKDLSWMKYKKTIQNAY